MIERYEFQFERSFNQARKKEKLFSPQSSPITNSFNFPIGNRVSS